MSPRFLLNDAAAQALVINLRLPRLLAALILGAILGAGGCTFQMLFGNPLVEPGFLGVSQGAAFGAALAILILPAGTFMIQASSAFFALGALFLSYFVAQRLHFGGWIIRLLLSGLAVAALFSSGVGMLKIMADPLSELPEITFWMLGGLWATTWDNLLPILLPTTAALVILHAMRWRINLLSFDDRVAASLGSAPARERLILLIVAGLGVASVTSLAGIIGWVGLLIPAMGRRLFSSNSKWLLPASMALGAMFTMLCDTLARSVMAGELPLGVITAFAGAILFIILLASGQRSRR